MLALIAVLASSWLLACTRSHSGRGRGEPDGGTAETVPPSNGGAGAKGAGTNGAAGPNGAAGTRAPGHPAAGTAAPDDPIGGGRAAVEAGRPARDDAGAPKPPAVPMALPGLPNHDCPAPDTTACRRCYDAALVGVCAEAEERVNAAECRVARACIGSYCVDRSGAPLDMANHCECVQSCLRPPDHGDPCTTGWVELLVCLKDACQGC